MSDIDDILKKYGRKISNEIDESEIKESKDLSKEYIQFKRDMMPQLSRFERFAYSFGGILRVNVSEKDRINIQRNLDTAHLDVSPSEVVSFAFSGAFITFFIGLLTILAVFFLQDEDIVTFFLGPAGLFLFLIFVASAFIFYYLYTSPQRLANAWRLKAGSQMVSCILYLVVYMKHTSNLERAVAFASQNLQPPLSLDLRKIFWDVETGRFSTIKESLDNYLKTWEKNSIEFVESFHLIESSLYEPSEARRVQILEKALQVILDGVYESMLVYSRQIRSPLTNLYMLGVVLPTLGLALLPLASTLLGGMIKSYHVFILFNLIIPFFVFYLSSQIMLKRPGGYGESEILELNPNYPQYKSKKPYIIAFLLCLPFLLIGLIPFLFQWQWFLQTTNLQPDYSLSVLGIESLNNVYLFDFKDVQNNSATITTVSQLSKARDVVGPFGLGALIFGLFIPISVAMFFSIAFKLKTKEMINSRNYTKQLEKEFTNSLFQLGNRIGDGMPAEMAFSRVAESTKGQMTEDFFRRVNLNLNQGGMSLEKSIFDKNRGAIIYFPSQLIATSMKILLESVKKGLQIAAQSLMSISEYIKNIHKVEQRLNDLLAEVVSDMKGNMVFLAPLLSGIVIGLTAMIAFILNILGNIFTNVETTGADISGLGGLSGMLNLFQIATTIPPYFMQIAIGIYLVEIIFILTSVLVVIDSGEDKLKKTYDTGKNLKRGIIMYIIVAFFAILVLSILAAVALSGLGAG